MRRPLEPYIRILEEFLADTIDPLQFRTQTIEQYDQTDARVNWVEEWDADVSQILEQMNGDAEVYYPEAPGESYITLDELRASSARNIAGLRAAIARRSG